MAKKYIKNEKGIVRAVTTDNLQLEKPLLNENYDIEVHNRNMDKIDTAVTTNKTNIENLQASSGNLSQLQTIDKSNLVSAINEVFQNANNGKELIATAIGEPLSKEETFSAMSNDINGLLRTFKTNMINNGVTVESGDKFKHLIDKINTMVEESQGKGMQYATGVCDVSGIAGTSNTKWDISVNIGFTPTIILALVNLSGGSGYYASNQPVTNLGYTTYDSMSGGTRGYIISNVTKSSFSITTQPNTTAKHAIYNTLTYYAIGVREEDTTLRDSLASILQEGGVDVTEGDDMASLIIKVEELIAQHKK